MGHKGVEHFLCPPEQLRGGRVLPGDGVERLLKQEGVRLEQLHVHLLWIGLGDGFQLSCLH